MIKLGAYNTLHISDNTDFGLYLEDAYGDRVLLPKRHLPDGLDSAGKLTVFVYLDSEDRPVATTQRPLVTVGECAALRVKEINHYGAFMDWGLDKDLLLPYNEQHKPMEEGRRYVVYVYLDARTDRIVASSRLSHHLSEAAGHLKPGQEVDLLICGRSDMGYKAVINNTHLGLVYKDEAFRALHYGSTVRGFVKSIRPDQKINLSLQRPAQRGREELSSKILDYLHAHGGVSTITDKSPPNEIYDTFQVSKSNYKKALGALYKLRKIRIEKDKISLADGSVGIV